MLRACARSSQRIGRRVISCRDVFEWVGSPSEGPDVNDYPTGTVTFVFTDVVESSRLWEEHHEAMQAAIAALV